MQPGQLLELVDLLALVINQHLKQQHLPLLVDKFMHWLRVLDTILYRALCSLNQTSTLTMAITFSWGLLNRLLARWPWSGLSGLS